MQGIITLSTKTLYGRDAYENSFTEYINTTDGVWHLDTNNLQQHNHYLPGKKISWTLEDKEKNIWFATLGEGVYKLGAVTSK